MQTLFTAQQVSKLLNISNPTVYRLAEQGILPAVVIARRGRKRILRFRPETLEKFVVGCEQKQR